MYEPKVSVLFKLPFIHKFILTVITDKIEGDKFKITEYEEINCIYL